MDGEKLKKVRDALRLIAEGERRLRQLKVLRSNKDIDADLAEWLSAQVEGGELASSRSQRAWDVEANGSRLEVKKDRKGEDNSWRGRFWVAASTLSELEPDDVVVRVLLRNDRSVEGYYSVPVRDLQALPSVPQGGLRLPKSWLESYRRHVGLLEEPLIGESTDREVMIVDLPAAAISRLEEQSNQLGFGSIEEFARELLLQRAFPLPENYGEVTAEELSYLADELNSREDLAWDEETTTCAEAAATVPATLS
jgi:hypothetical protein